MSGAFDPPLLTGDISYETRGISMGIINILARKQAVVIALCLPEEHYSQTKEKVFQEIKLVELNSEDGMSILFDFIDITFS